MGNTPKRRKFLAQIAILSAECAWGGGLTSFANEIVDPLPGHPVEFFLAASVRTARKAVVRVLDDTGRAGATGFFIGDRWLLTAAHVLRKTPIYPQQIMFVSNFELYREPSRREFFVWDENTEIIQGSELLDYALIRLKRAQSSYCERVHANAWLQGGEITRGIPWIADGYVIGHPESACLAFDRHWAYMTAKSATVSSTTSATEWQLNLSATTCNGFSGAPVVDANGLVLGLVSSKALLSDLNHYGRVISMAAIARDIEAKLGLNWAKPPGLKLVPAFGAREGSNLCPAKVTEGGKPPIRDEKYGLDQEDQRTAAKDPNVQGSVGLLRYFGNLGEKVVHGVCIHLGDGWLLSTKHLIINSARLATADIWFGESLPDLTTAGNWRLLDSCYFSSDDLIYSHDGKTAILDYALVRLIADEITYPPYVKASSRELQIGESLIIPRQQEENYDSDDQPYFLRSAYVPWGGDNLVQEIDTRRLYYFGAVKSGVSGAPLINSFGQLVGMHTNSLTPRCSAGRLEESGQPLDDCRKLEYWERRAEPVEERSYAYGTRVTAIIQDLRLRHKFDTDMVPAFRGLLLGQDADYKAGAA